jgi:hypothetical protein
LWVLFLLEIVGASIGFVVRNISNFGLEYWSSWRFIVVDSLIVGLE